MFKKLIGVGAVVFGTASLVVLFSPITAHANGETYLWQDYSSIGAKGGEYIDAAGHAEGDSAAIVFTQSETNPAVYEVEPALETCEGKLTITLSSSTNNTGVLSSSGNCPLFAKLSKTLTLANPILINSKVDNDSKLMNADFKRQACSTTLYDQAEVAQCEAAAKDKYELSATECKAQNNFAESTFLANKYLDCLAEKLGVERPSDQASEEALGQSSNKCAIENVGWIMCQAMQFIAWITDKSFDLLSGFLEVEPLKEHVSTSAALSQNNPTPGSSSPPEDTKLHAAWKVSLGFANVIFIFVFMMMLFAYFTNKGLSVYNLKVLGPRLVVAALLVNMSFFMCGVAVDLSNILGGTLRSTLVDITPPATGSDYTSWTQLTDRITSITPADEEFNKENNPAPAQPTPTPPPPPAAGEEEDKELWPEPTSAVLAGVALTGGVVLFANLSALIPFMVAALAAVITVLIILIIRQAAIICLIAIAPIAFALILLPNTKQWFNRWLDIFSKLLILYPAVSLIFGASYLASHVVQDQASENSQTFVAIFALGIQLIPLFITPLVLKLSGGAFDRLAGVVNNPNKGPIDRMKKAASEFRDDRKQQQIGRAASGSTTKLRDPSSYINLLKNPNAARLRKNMRKTASNSAINSALKNAEKTAFTDEKSIRSATKGVNEGHFLDELIEESLAEAAQSVNAIDVRRVGATIARFRQSGVSADSLQNMATSGVNEKGEALSDIERSAAIQMAANTAESDKAHALILASGSMNGQLRRALVDSLRSSGFSKQNAHFGGSALNAVAEGNITRQSDIDTLMLRAAEGGKFSAATISTQSAYSLKMLGDTIDSGIVSPAASNRVIENAHLALSTPTLNSSINTNSRPGVERLAR